MPLTLDYIIHTRISQTLPNLLSSVFSYPQPSGDISLLPEPSTTDHSPLSPFSSIRISLETPAAQIVANMTTTYQVVTPEDWVLHDDDAIIHINKEINKNRDIANQAIIEHATSH